MLDFRLAADKFRFPTRGAPMKILLAALFVVNVFAIPVFTSSSADACTNSYDRASDGSRCGQRASGCRSGGRGGNC
jgi:hypothetical protein